MKRADHATTPSPAVPARLPAALLAAASGIHPLEAGTSLLIDCGCWLHREDFTSQFITTATSISDGTTLLASIDWAAAVTALDAGKLPSRGGERRVLRLAASIAGGIPVSSTTTCLALTSATRALSSTPSCTQPDKKPISE
jgi:hypothetical protein